MIAWQSWQSWLDRDAVPFRGGRKRAFHAGTIAPGRQVGSCVHGMIYLRHRLAGRIST